MKRKLEENWRENEDYHTNISDQYMYKYGVTIQLKYTM